MPRTRLTQHFKGRWKLRLGTLALLILAIPMWALYGRVTDFALKCPPDPIIRHESLKPFESLFGQVSHSSRLLYNHSSTLSEDRALIWTHMLYEKMYNPAITVEESRFPIRLLEEASERFAQLNALTTKAAIGIRMRVRLLDESLTFISYLTTKLALDFDKLDSQGRFAIMLKRHAYKRWVWELVRIVEFAAEKSSARNLDDRIISIERLAAMTGFRLNQTYHGPAGLWSPFEAKLHFSLGHGWERFTEGDPFWTRLIGGREAIKALAESRDAWFRIQVLVRDMDQRLNQGRWLCGVFCEGEGSTLPEVEIHELAAVLKGLIVQPFTFQTHDYPKSRQIIRYEGLQSRWTGIATT